MNEENQDSALPWELVEPFDVDGNELEGISPAECFALGVEWAQFRQKLATGQPFNDLCLANNAARLNNLAERRQRFVEHGPASVKGWSIITVGDHVV